MSNELTNIIDFNNEEVKSVFEKSKEFFKNYFKTYFSNGTDPSQDRIEDWSHLCAFIQDGITNKNKYFCWDSTFIFPSGIEGKLVDIVALYEGWGMLHEIGLYDPISEENFVI